MTIPNPYSPKLRDHAVARKFVSQNGRGYLALSIYDASGALISADDGTLQLKVYYDDLSGADPALVINVIETTGIVQDGVGLYHYDIGPAWTKNVGLLNAEWTYKVNDVEFTFNDYLQVLEQMPTFDRLRPDAQLAVEQVSWFFGDLFDSTAGGPWLQENFQTHFSYERIAFLSTQAVMKLNLLGFPVTNWGVTLDDPKIPKNFQPLSVWATKLECIRHLALSYTEQPDFRNMQVTYTDRRDYSDRWRAVLDEETPQFEKAVTMAKRSLLRLGRGSVMVAGGLYGGGLKGGFFIPGLYAAQTRSLRFYPASFAIGVGNIVAGGAV